MELGRVFVRNACIEDAAALLPLMEAFNRSEGIDWDADRTKSALDELLAEPRLGFVLVAESAGELAGYLVLTYGWDLEFGGRDAFITELYVVPDARRTGIARTLLAEADSMGRANGVRATHLMVLPENTAAIALYRSLGFEPSPRRMYSRMSNVEYRHSTFPPT